jgi:hypothetical protein
MPRMTPHAACRWIWPCLVTALTASVAIAGDASRPTDDLLGRARLAWVAFESALGSVLAEEDYRQEATWPQTLPGNAVVRRLRSELLLFQVPGSSERVTFRHVEQVDGEPPLEPSPSIAATLADTSRPLNARVGELVRASAFYNLGDFERTINTPTFAAMVLRPEHTRRVRFHVEGETTIDGQPVAVVRFEETARPTIVRGHGTRDVPMRGRLWLRTDTGQVLRSELVMKSSPNRVTATIEVDFGHDEGLQMLVPQVMRERYEHRKHVVTTEARYTRYRRFTTSVRVIGD